MRFFLLTLLITCALVGAMFAATLCTHARPAYCDTACTR